MARQYDKVALMQDVCDLNHVRESMYSHLPESAFCGEMTNPGRMIAKETLGAIAMGSSSRTAEEGAALLGVVCDDLLFALQEAVRML